MIRYFCDWCDKLVYSLDDLETIELVPPAKLRRNSRVSLPEDTHKVCEECVEKVQQVITDLRRGS
jgi:hypothetical protein